MPYWAGARVRRAAMGATDTVSVTFTPGTTHEAAFIYSIFLGSMTGATGGETLTVTSETIPATTPVEIYEEVFWNVGDVNYVFNLGNGLIGAKGEEVVLYARKNKQGTTKLAYALRERYDDVISGQPSHIGAVGSFQA